MVPGDHQPPALRGQLGGEVQGPLLAHRLDHPLAEAAGRQGLDLLDDGVVVVHGDDLGRAHAAGDLERERPAGDCDHPRPGVGRQAGEDGAQEADADDRHGLSGGDLAAPEDVHGAAQRLSREGLVIEPLRQGDHRAGVGEIPFGIAVERERRDATTDQVRIDAFSGRIDHAPAFVAEAARLGGELHPLRPRPWRQIGGADAAAFEPHAHLAGTRRGDIDLSQLQPARAGEHRGAHGGGPGDRAFADDLHVHGSGCQCGGGRAAG